MCAVRLWINNDPLISLYWWLQLYWNTHTHSCTCYQNANAYFVFLHCIFVLDWPWNWNGSDISTTDCQQLWGIGHHVTGPDLVRLFAQGKSTQRGCTGSYQGYVEEKKREKNTIKNKKKILKVLQRASLNLSVRWWWKEPIPQLPGAQPFISFSLFRFFYWEMQIAKCSLQSEASITQTVCSENIWGY